MNTRLLVTGGGGFVAGSVVRQAHATWEVHVLSGKPRLVERAGLVWHTLDMLDGDELGRAFHEVKPDAVIHAAAIADIDYCQAHPQMADAVNVELTRRLVELCRGSGAKMVFLSSDTVFDGERGQYREEDPPRPVNYYAETKLAGERLVAEGVENAVVARLALVMGFPLMGEGNSFLTRFVRALDEGRTVPVPAEEVRTPIDAITLGRALLELASGRHAGFFHLAGNDTLARIEMARRMARALGHSPDLVVPTDPAALAGRARRPRDVSLDNRKAAGTLHTRMLGFDEAVRLIWAERRERRLGIAHH